MAINTISKYLVLDVYQHDKTPETIKAIAADNDTRYIAAEIRNNGDRYDVTDDSIVTLLILRPDGVGVGVAGEPRTLQYETPGSFDPDTGITTPGETVTHYGVYAELDQAALAISGTLLGQFKITNGEQILRTQLFHINNGRALDTETSDWSGEYQGYNLDELVQSVNTAVGKVNAMETDVSELKSGFNELQNGGYIADAQQIQEKIDKYLDEHPEATTTVQDGSLTEAKFTDALKAKTIKDYVTPQMFGAVGDSVTDDRQAIQDALDTAHLVFIPKGTYCISDSLKMHAGQTLIGEGDLSTTIKAISDTPIFENGDNSNYITIKNLKLDSEVESTHYAIDIKGSIVSPYTGATYSVFENIYIQNFESGIFLNHVWNTKLKNIRVNNCVTNGIWLGGGCNNIILELPMLERLKNGIRITTSQDDSTQNTNITIINPDIEYCEKAIYSYNTYTLSVFGIYTEHNDIVVSASGTRALSVNGIYSAYDTRFADLTNTKASITNGFFSFNSNNDVGIISTDSFLDMDNLAGVNNGTGKIFCLVVDISSYNPLIYEELPYDIESNSFRLRYSTDNYSGIFKVKENAGNQFSCFRPYLVVTSQTLTATSGDTVQLYRNGSIVATASINNGTVLSNGLEIQLNPVNTNAKNFIYENGDEYEIKHSNTTGVDVNFKVVFKNIKRGKFIIN